MKNLYEVIKRGLLSEKTNIQKELNNKITFEVDRRSNKIEIKQAVEQIFKVKVVDVRTMVVRGKEKRVGRSIGKRPDWKKAIVTLKSGERIPFLEGA